VGEFQKDREAVERELFEMRQEPKTEAEPVLEAEPAPE
jgi:hypothetical protein